MADEPEKIEEPEPIEPVENDEKVTESVKEWLQDNDTPDEDDTKTEPEPEKDEEEQSEPEKPEEPEPSGEPEFSEELLDQAYRIGLSQQEIESLGPKGTEIAIAQSYRVARLYEPPQTEGQQEEKKAEEEVPELDEDVDDSIRASVDWLKKSLTDLRKENTGLRDELSRVQSSLQTSAQRELEERNTQQVATALEQIYASGMTDVFGPNADDATDAQFTNVRAVMRTAGILKRGYEEAGIQPPSDIVQRAVRAEFGDRMVSGQREKISQAVRRRSGSSVARPTQRISSNSEGSDDKAVATAKAWLEANSE